MAYSTETVEHFIGRVNDRLEQEFDPGTNFWTKHEIREYMLEGTREVWSLARASGENWFMRQLKSTDGLVMAGGRQFDTALLKLSTGIMEIPLPSDFAELKMIEAIVQAGTSLPGVTFEYANQTQRIFRDGTVEQFTDTSTRRRYKYDIEFRTAGAFIVLSPRVQLESPQEIIIKYIQSAPDISNPKASFEGTGFTLEMVDAIFAYTVWTAFTKEGLQESMGPALTKWNSKRELVTGNAGKRQTRDAETVDGFLEEEL